MILLSLGCSLVEQMQISTSLYPLEHWCSFEWYSFTLVLDVLKVVFGWLHTRFLTLNSLWTKGGCQHQICWQFWTSICAHLITQMGAEQAAETCSVRTTGFTYFNGCVPFSPDTLWIFLLTKLLSTRMCSEILHSSAKPGGRPRLSLRKGESPGFAFFTVK